MMYVEHTDEYKNWICPVCSYEHGYNGFNNTSGPKMVSYRHTANTPVYIHVVAECRRCGYHIEVRKVLASKIKEEANG